MAGNCRRFEPQLDATPAVVPKSRNLKPAARAQEVGAVQPVVGAAPAVAARVWVWAQPDAVDRIDCQAAQGAGWDVAVPADWVRIDSEGPDRKGRPISIGQLFRLGHLRKLFDWS
ncbi:hypothetical protein GCM10023145_37110 [Angustibacter luteus]